MIKLWLPRDGGEVVDGVGRERATHRIWSSRPVTNRKNAQNSPGCIRQTKTVRFSPEVAPDHIRGASLGGRDRLVFAGQDAGFLLNRNASPQPIDCEQCVSFRER